MCVYACMCVCMSACVCVYACMCVCVCMRACTCMCVCVSACRWDDVGSTHHIMRILQLREAILVQEAGVGQWSICVHDLLPLSGMGRREGEKGGGGGRGRRRREGEEGGEEGGRQGCINMSIYPAIALS